MLLSCRMLQDVSGVNSFEYAEAAEFTEGDAASVYFQLIDRSKDARSSGFVPSGRRYMPAAGATLEVVLDHLDDGKKVTRAASQPYPQDPSIWKLDVMASDKVLGTVTMRLALTEGAVVTRGSLAAALLVRAA